MVWLEKDVLEQGEKLGPKKARGELKQVDTIEANIKAQAKAKVAIAELKEGEVKKSQETRDSSEKAVKEKETVLKEKEAILKKSEASLASANPIERPFAQSKYEEARGAHAEADKAYKTASADFASAQAKVIAFEKQEKEYAEELKKQMGAVAEQMGVDLDDLTEKKEKLNKDIERGIEEQNKYAKYVAEQGSILTTGFLGEKRGLGILGEKGKLSKGILSSQKNRELADKIIAGYNPKDYKKVIEDLLKKEDEKPSKPPEEPKTPKP